MENTIGATFLIAWLFGSLVCGIFTAVLADAKGYSLGWFAAGFFFSIIALITMVGMPVKKPRVYADGSKEIR